VSSTSINPESSIYWAGEMYRRKKIGGAMIISGSKGVEDGIVRGAEVSPKQLDNNIRVCHLGEGAR